MVNFLFNQSPILPPPPQPPCAPSNEIRPLVHAGRIFSIKVQISMIFAVHNQIFNYMFEEAKLLSMQFTKLLCHVKFKII